MTLESRVTHRKLGHIPIVDIDLSSTHETEYLEIIFYVDKLLKENEDQFFYFLMNGSKTIINTTVIEAWRKVIIDNDSSKFCTAVYGLNTLRRNILKIINYTKVKSIISLTSKEKAEHFLIEYANQNQLN